MTPPVEIVKVDPVGANGEEGDKTVSAVNDVPSKLVIWHTSSKL